MEQDLDPGLVTALTALAARVDALTWVAGALLQAHPRPDAVLTAWRARQPDSADSGFEIGSPEYQAKFLEELRLWTGTLESYAKRG